MNRDLRFYFLVIGLPALLLALGGLRLLTVESQRAYTLGRDALQAKATLAAADVRRRIREYEDGVRERAEQLSEWTTNSFSAFAETEPLVRSVSVVQRAKGAGAGRWRVHVELEPLAVLARVPGWLEENGTESDASDQNERATTIEVRGTDGRLLIPSTARRRGGYFVSASLAPELPGVRVGVAWRDGRELAAQARFRIWFIGSTVLALLLGTLLAGGILLVRAAWRARLEARRETDFTANVSHEFKTPLTGIRLAAEFAKEHAGDDLTRQALQDVLEGTDRLWHLVSDVLDYGRLADGKPLATEPEDVGDGVVAEVNHAALRHILENLEDNAAKYAPGAPPERRVRAEGDWVYIDVMDRGPGMSAEERAKAFDRFWRADNSTARTTGGCGLGLSIARLLARAQGGDLTVAPREGGGTIFTVKLRKVVEKNG
ncbi:MAG: HAMP domain-containing histidine kinase [Kiritimatiellae bacterium]|nr:HAMP domain-containing histidine kinase [Kiritimatiellia bacterium]